MFKSKVIIVTGSSTGIGAAAAIKFAEQGSKGLVIHGRQEEALKKVKVRCEKAGKGSTKVHMCIGDITEEAVRKDLIDSAISLFGQLDVLVNNAGVGLTGPFTETPIEAYDKVFNVNVRSVMALTQLAIPHLIKSKGNIVNISSGLGMKPNQFAFVYSCSKATLDHFTKCLALELGPEGVRVNAVNPGYIVGTEIMTRHGGEANEEFLKRHLDVIANSYPLRRAGTVEETADAIAFIASDQARFITGALLPVDGGYTKT